MPKTTHGKTYHPLYFVWHSMMRRCYNPTHKHFRLYGGRGIVVDPQWHNINAFVEDMYPSFSRGLTLDRVNNDLGYNPENCRWATTLQQGRNRSTNRRITIGGRTLAMSEWRDVFGISKGAVQKRLRKGMTIEQALQTPIDNRFRRVA